MKTIIAGIFHFAGGLLITTLSCLSLLRDALRIINMTDFQMLREILMLSVGGVMVGLGIYFLTKAANQK